MPIVLDGTAGIDNNATDLSYTGTLTGGTGVVNLGSGQLFKDASGNVGIGTSSPVAKNHIRGSGTSGQVTASWMLENFSSGTAGMDITGAAGASRWRYLYGGGPGTGTNTLTEAMCILTEGASAGSLLVGTTSTLGDERLRVVHSLAGAFGAIVESSNASFSGQVLQIRAANTSTNNTYNAIQFSAAGTERFKVQDNGNVNNTNNSYGAISDVKLKENVTDATPKLENLNQVRVVNYNLIGQEQKQIGVIAQELEQIFPGMVEESPDRDTDGNDLGTTTKAVKYSVFVPMLIKGVQELKAINDAQAQTIESLTARVVALENQIV